MAGTPYTESKTSYSYDTGFIVFPNPHIIPNLLFDDTVLANGDNTALAGEVVANGPFYGVLEKDVDGSEDELRDLYVRGIFRVKKTNDTSGKAIAKGDYVTFVANPTGTKNDVWAEKATPETDEVHGYALEAAASADTEVVILLAGDGGPYPTAPAA